MDKNMKKDFSIRSINEKIKKLPVKEKVILLVSALLAGIFFGYFVFFENVNKEVQGYIKKEKYWERSYKREKHKLMSQTDYVPIKDYMEKRKKALEGMNKYYKSLQKQLIEDRKKIIKKIISQKKYSIFINEIVQYAKKFNIDIYSISDIKNGNQNKFYSYVDIIGYGKYENILKFLYSIEKELFVKLDIIGNINTLKVSTVDSKKKKGEKVKFNIRIAFFTFKGE